MLRFLHRWLPSSSCFFSLIIPLSALIILILVPPHGLDISISKLFYQNGWPLKDDALFTLFFYKLPKYIPALAFVTVLLFCVRSIARGEHLLQTDRSYRCIYLIVSMLVCAIAVWWLKSVTAVACPWSTEVFAGSLPITNPSFHLTCQPGKCWPSGHAGCGFVFWAFFFAFKDRQPKLASAFAVFTVCFGLFCGTVRIMQGAHFFSHVFATAIIDWLICYVLYLVFFGPKLLFRSKVSQLNMPTLILVSALWWTLIFNTPFFSRLIGLNQNHFAWTLDSVGLLAALIIGFFALSVALISLLNLLPDILSRSILLLLNLVASAAFCATCLYGVVFTPDMVRNILSTNAYEAVNYYSYKLILLMLAGSLPIVFLTLSIPLQPYGIQRIGRHCLWLLLGLLTGLGVLLTQLDSLAGLLRTDRESRYLIAPMNVPYSLYATLVKDDSPDNVTKRPMDPSPQLMSQVKRPAVLLVVIGETTRSASWGVAGYARNTTPNLSQSDVIHFPSILACGTSTDVSLPCMLSPIGRSDYNRKQILSTEALPGLLQRAGVSVQWVDNQSGCKGTCQNVAYRTPTFQKDLCSGGQCQDSILIDELKEDLKRLPNDRPTVLFYHMYGEHGPRYDQNSPKEMKQWLPECQDANLGSCSSQSVRNAYDNAVLYTDYVLSRLLQQLKDASDEVDTAMIFVSDHGESLGENGLYLHGAPYLIAPDEQLQVPMFMWFSRDWSSVFQVNTNNVFLNNKQSITHEHLYSTILKLLNIQSNTYRASWDLTQ